MPCIQKMYESSNSAILLEGEKSDAFKIEQGMAQGCSLSPILFSVFINDLLKEVGCLRKPLLIKKFYHDLFSNPIGGTFLNPVTNDIMLLSEIPIVLVLSTKCGVFFGRKYISIYRRIWSITTHPLQQPHI